MKLIRSMAMASLAMAMMLAWTPAHAASKGNENGQGKAVVTILPQKGSPALTPVPLGDLQLKVEGRVASVTGWVPLADAAHRIEIVVLIDDGAQSSLGTQISSIQDFIRKLPDGAAVALGYMGNGRALLTGPMTTDHAEVLRKLRPPAGGSPGISASPYFCLSDLIKKWPSKDAQARREVVMITEGVDYYEDGYNPNDPYVAAAISDALRNNTVVYSIYWGNQGAGDGTGSAATTGQNLLAQVSEAVGGKSYWTGFGNPVSMESYFADIALRIANQYQLEYATELKGAPAVVSMKLRVKSTTGKVDAPTQTYVQRKPDSQ